MSKIFEKILKFRAGLGFRCVLEDRGVKTGGNQYFTKEGKEHRKLF